jgi:hypothetical protein
MERESDYNNVNNNADNNVNNNAVNNHNHGDDVPLAMHSHLLRMLYELRVPIWMRQEGGGAYDDYVDNAMEQSEAAAVLAGSLYDVRPVKHVVDIADGETGEKHGIRQMAYNKEIAEEMKINTACGIWQEEFVPDQAIKILPCNHAFDAEAITKWLTTEKAECPMCRFKLESKEVIVRPPAGDDNDMPALVSDDDDEDDDIDDMPEPHPQPNPPVDEQRARENNIMYRLNNIIYNRAHGGGAADMGRDHHYGVSMPMNRLLQMRAGLVHGARAGGAAGAAGGAAGVGVSQPPQLSQNHLHPHPHPQNPIVTSINYYYVNPINRYMISVEGQEQLDIEEAIRRSLEE